MEWCSIDCDVGADHSCHYLWDLYQLKNQPIEHGRQLIQLPMSRGLSSIDHCRVDHHQLGLRFHQATELGSILEVWGHVYTFDPQAYQMVSTSGCDLVRTMTQYTGMDRVNTRNKVHRIRLNFSYLTSELFVRLGAQHRAHIRYVEAFRVYLNGVNLLEGVFPKAMTIASSPLVDRG